MDIDPCNVQFKITDLKDYYLIEVLDIKNMNFIHGQCLVDKSGDIIFSDFNKDMNEVILGELNVSS